MGYEYKEGQTCPDHGFALDAAGACLRCVNEASAAASGRRTAKQLLAGAILFSLLGVGAAWAHARVARPVAVPPGETATKVVPVATEAPAPTASAERHAVLEAWKEDLARIEAKRAAELAVQAEHQAAAEKQRLLDARRPVATFARAESDAWPSLAFEAFLADDSDVERRQELWLLFRPAEREARAFATSRERWLPIKGVAFGMHGRLLGMWSTTRVIQLQTDTDASVLFHELFHPVFHASELNPGKGDRDGAWNEAFCDAFAYYAERELLPEPRSRWATQLDGLAELAAEEALRDADPVKRKYRYPASLIVKHLGGPKGSMDDLAPRPADQPGRRRHESPASHPVELTDGGGGTVMGARYGLADFVTTGPLPRPTVCGALHANRENGRSGSDGCGVRRADRNRGRWGRRASSGDRRRFPCRDRRHGGDATPKRRGDHPRRPPGGGLDGAATSRRRKLGQFRGPAHLLHGFVSLHRALRVLRAARGNTERGELPGALRPTLPRRRRLPGLADVPRRCLCPGDDVSTGSDACTGDNRRNLRRRDSVRRQRVLYRRVAAHVGVLRGLWVLHDLRQPVPNMHVEQSVRLGKRLRQWDLPGLQRRRSVRSDRKVHGDAHELHLHLLRRN